MMEIIHERYMELALQEAEKAAGQGDQTTGTLSMPPAVTFAVNVVEFAVSVGTAVMFAVAAIE